MVHLTKEAVARLGIETGLVELGSTPRSRLVGGEVVAPPGQTITVTAPVAGMVRFAGDNPLTPGTTIERNASLLRLIALAPADRDTRARVVREVAAANANLAALELRVTRNQALVAERAGSSRALEEAIAARDIAKADLVTARARSSTLARAPLLSDVSMDVRAPHTGVIRMLSASEGQIVPAGAPLFEIVVVDALQVRVPVYSGDLGRIDVKKTPRVYRSGEDRIIDAPFSPGPPTAETDRNTVDRYLSLPAHAGFALGERILVELPLHDAGASLTIPTSSIVIDAWGGAWVYQCGEGSYTRTRVNPAWRSGDKTVIAHGPAAGTCIVSTGAAELFGAEFPAGH